MYFVSVYSLQTYVCVHQDFYKSETLYPNQTLTFNLDSIFHVFVYYFDVTANNKLTNRGIHAYSTNIPFSFIAKLDKLITQQFIVSKGEYKYFVLSKLILFFLTIRNLRYLAFPFMNITNLFINCMQISMFVFLLNLINRNYHINDQLALAEI